MTKENFIDIISPMVYERVKHGFKETICKFFEQNVVIPKGTNRHPYADVLHEWIEGADIEVNLEGIWTDYNCSREYIDKYEYRIKPQEPVYEYKYSIVLAGKQYISEEYKTIEEIKDFNNIYLPVAIEETKRVRQ